MSVLILTFVFVCCGILPVYSNMSLSPETFGITDNALVDMASSLETFRTIFQQPAVPNNVEIINLNLCDKWDVRSNKCIVKPMKLFILKHNSDWPYFKSNRQLATFPLCNLGYGESGCGSLGHMTSSCGTIRSLSLTSFKGMEACEWTISVDEGYKIEVTFTYFRIRHCTQMCDCDSVIIFDVINETLIERGKYCGHRDKWTFLSNSNILKISKRSDIYATGDFYASNQKTGFIAGYKKMPLDKHVVMTTPKYIYSINGTFSLHTPLPSVLNLGNVTYQWLIRTDEIKRIKLNWTVDSLCSPLMTIHNGPSSNGNIIYDSNRNVTPMNHLSSLGFQLFIEATVTQASQCDITWDFTSYDVPLITEISGSNNTNDWQFVQLNITEGAPISIRFLGSQPILSGYIFTVNQGEYVSIRFTTYKFEGPDQNNCDTEGVLIWDGLSHRRAKKYGPFCSQYIQNAFFNSTQQPYIHSSTNILTVLFYQFGTKNGETLVEMEVKSTICMGILDWNELQSIPSLKPEVTLKNGEKVVKLNPQAGVCFRLHSFPNITNSPNGTSIKVMFNASHNLVEEIITSPLSHLCDPDTVEIDSRTIKLTLHNEKNCGLFVSVKSHKEFWAQCPKPIPSLDIKNKSLSGSTIIAPKSMCGHVTFQFLDEITIVLVQPINLPDNYQFMLKFDAPAGVQSSPIEIHVFEYKSELTVLESPELNIYEYPFIWSTSWGYKVQIELEFKSPRFPLVMQYQLDETDYPQAESAQNTGCQDIPNNNSTKAFLYDGYCYWVVPSIPGRPIPWVEAEAGCKSQGGELLSVYTVRELNFIKGLIRDHFINLLVKSNNVFYIGLVKSFKEHRWTNGEPVIITDWYQRSTSKDQLFSQELFGNDVTFAFPTLSQPSDLGATKCSAMVISTPMMPTNWIMVPCHYPYDKANYICKKNVKPTYLPKPLNTGFVHKVTASNQTLLYPGQITCPEGWNYLNGMCLKIISSHQQINVSLTCEDAMEICTRIGGHLADITRNSFPDLLNLLKAWRYVLDYGGIWLGKCQGVYGIAHENMISEPTITMSLPPVGILMLNVICERSSVKTEHSCGKLQYACSDGTCILDHHECDGVADCFDAGDEEGCVCQSSDFQCQDGTCIPMSKYCDFVTDCKDESDEKNCTFSSCPVGNRACKNGQCLTASRFDDQVADCLDASDEDVTSPDVCPSFKCYSGKCIPKEFVYNNREDCGSTMEDEIFHQKDLKRGSWIGISPNGIDIVDISNHQPFCLKGNESYGRCRFDHLSCFPRHKACVYARDKYGYMAYCADGSHLRDCEHYQCPNMFKCPNSYCLPYSKVCDGIRDCIGGADETDCKQLTCPGLFKCRTEGYCIDQSAVCDGINDCTMSHDDEALCDFLDCPHGCQCIGRTIICLKAGFRKFPSFSYHSRSITLSGDSIQISNETVLFYPYLGKFNISNNDINVFPKGVFKHLVNLLLLDLSNNNLTSLNQGSFWGLNSLQHLDIQENPLHTIGTLSFSGLNTINKLNLNQIGINVLKARSFSGLPNLVTLSLNNNSLSHIDSSIFSDLSSLKFLYLQGNKITKYEVETFNELTLDELHTDEFKFCCYAKYVDVCTPGGDAFSSCEDLMANKILQVAIWVLGICALIGNIFVVIWRAITQGKRPDSFMIVNLAISDLLMGVYLIIIASTDVQYRGKYILYADEWKQSVLCKTAGFVSTLSSEMSVYMMSVITADRFFRIVYPFTVKKISFKKALLLSLSGWVVFAILAAIPVSGLSYFGDSFIQNGVCLLFNITSGKSPGWEYTTFLYLIFNFLVFIFIFFAYIVMYSVLNKSRQNSKRRITQSDEALARRFFLIVLTDFICWIPIIVTAFLALGGIPVHPQVSVWLAVFILPFNSAINPFLYTITSLWQMRKRQAKTKTLATSVAMSQ